MDTTPLIGIASIFVLGIAAQWLAWRLRLPSILLLFVFGFVAGPATGFIMPDELLGHLLFPMVSLSVGVLLFEGGLSLKLGELKHIGGAVRNLMTLGLAVTWVLAAVAAHWVLGMETGMAILLGAVLVVTGPTVVGPLMRLVRPTGKVAAILKWESILIDPVGAAMALLVYEALVADGGASVTGSIAMSLLTTVATGLVLGAAAGALIVLFLRRYWVADYLTNAFILMVLVLAFAVSNRIQHDSGLLTATVMGLVLANQKRVAVKHVAEFKEHLVVLLISALFIVLAARLKLEDLTHLDWRSAVFLAALVLVVRPTAVALSMVGSGLTWREQALVAWIAPRGIVAAAVASVFAIRLADSGRAGAQMLVPVTFLVIVGTIAIYGLSALPLARRLKVTQENPQGVLFIGAHALTRAIAAVLKQRGLAVLLADTNRVNIRTARMEGLPTYYGNIMTSYALENVDLGGIGRLLAMTPNDEANALATLSMANLFGRKEVYQLVPEGHAAAEQSPPHELHGRLLFDPQATYRRLVERLQAGAVVKAINITDEFSLEAFAQRYGQTAIPLFIVDDGELTVVTAQEPPQVQEGQTLIALLDEPKDEAKDQPKDDAKHELKDDAKHELNGELNGELNADPAPEHG